MNNNEYINTLFHKFINDILDEKEFDILMEYLKKTKSQDEIMVMMDRHWDALGDFGKDSKKKTREETDILFNQIKNRIRDREEGQKKTSLIRRLKKSTMYKVAAVIVVLIGLFYFYQNDSFSKSQILVTEKNIDSNAIILTLDGGNKKIISENGTQKIIDKKGNIVGVQNGNNLSYSNKSIQKKLVYNELTVPNGKKFQILLSDGTKVHLNSGSSIRFPIQFINGKKREVYLKGEAYFDVAKHEGHSFVVNVNDINVKVLGTQFNVSYYPEDININTVLVEGSVKLYTGANENNSTLSKLLTPGHKATWDITKKNMLVEKVNTDIYTSWRKGVLVFKNTTFGNIRKKLERHFNISIDNQYKLLDEQIYTATFREEGIQEILDVFSENMNFNYSIVEKNKILITK